MASEYTYSPRMDFFIERVDRATGFEMPCFHIHHKYEIYYEIEGTRRYFIEDAAYIVNAGSVVLIGDNQIHKTASVGDTPSSRIVLNFSAEYLGKIAEIFPEVDFFSFLSEEHNHLLSNITVKQQNHIYTMLQQLLELQEQTSAEGEAVRKMLLATLLLELKDLCKQQQAQGKNVDFLPEEHPEYRLPVGISGSGDLFRFRVAMTDGSKKLLVRKLIQFFMHIDHLPLEVKEILGSTVEMRTSPRMVEATVKMA